MRINKKKLREILVDYCNKNTVPNHSCVLERPYTLEPLKKLLQRGRSKKGNHNFFFSVGSIGVDIPWNQGRVIVSSPLYWYNWYDRYIYVRRPGWYFVKASLFSPTVNAAHEWGIKLISNIELNTPNYEVYSTYMDYQHTSKHPYVNGTGLFNAPEQAFKSNSGGLPAFKIRLYSTNSNINFESFNTYATLQVIRLSDLEHSQRMILSSV